MRRAITILFGLGLFGMGLFLGMVGSFFRTLPVEPPRALVAAPTMATNQPQPQVVQEKKSPRASAAHPPDEVTSELSEALALLATVLANQQQSPPQAPALPAPTAPDPELLQQLVSAAVAERMSAGEPAPALAPAPSEAGRWVFDQRVGWLWLPEGGAQVVLVPTIEVYPGGLVAIHRNTQRKPKTDAKASSKVPPGKPRSSVVQHDEPGSNRLPAWYPVTRP